MTDMKKYLLWIAALGVFALDRAAKILLPGNDSVLIPGILRLRYVENSGMAFGWLSGNTVLLAVFSVLLLLGAYLIIRPSRLKGLAAIGIGLILGGALGNLFDRLVLGYVIDLFDFLFVRFYVFNIADVMITSGVILAGAALILRKQDWSGK